MLDSFRNKRLMASAASAGTVVIAIILGTGTAAADTKVKFQNNLGVTVEVKITDPKAIEKTIPSLKNNETTKELGTVPANTTVKWVATPKDRAPFTTCKDEKKVAGAEETIVMRISEKCAKSSASAPGNKQADDKKKVDDQKKADDKKQAKIKIENTMDDILVADLKVSDALDNPYNTYEVAFIKNKEVHTTRTSFTIDKSGNFDIYISFKCEQGRKTLYSGGQGEYKASGTKVIQIVKTPKEKTEKKTEDECTLKRD